MNGIICIYKEKGPTSFDVVAQIKHIFGTKKVGHGGTLDPMAEGVLPIFIGNATKAADFCPDDTTQYLAGFKFGLTTDTQDITGNILSISNQYVSRNKMIMIERKFKGEQQQIPPMYSAVRVNGQRLYDLARKGVEVERKPRTITIYDLKIDNYENNQGTMLVTCSKGTYIRTLIHDIGQELGVGGVMTFLVRTKSGIFTVDQCYKLGDLAGRPPEELEKLLMPIEELYGSMPKAHLDEEQTRLFRNGAVLDADRILFDRIYDKGYYIEGCDGVFLGLGKISTDHSLEVFRRFNTDTKNKTAGEAHEKEQQNPAEKASETEQQNPTEEAAEKEQPIPADASPEEAPKEEERINTEKAKEEPEKQEDNSEKNASQESNPENNQE